MDGQGIGGSINLVTQTAFDFKKRVNLLVNAQVGEQELNDKRPVRGDISVGARLGANEQFGLLLGLSYSDRTFTSYGFYPDDWRPIDGAERGGLPTNIKFTDYSLERERLGATGSFDFRPGGNHEFYIRGIYSKFAEDEYRQRYRLDFATNALVNSTRFTLNPDGLTGTVTGTPNVGTGSGAGPEERRDLRLEQKKKSILAGMAGGSSRFSDSITLEYVLARVHNEVREPNELWQFRCNPGTVDFDFSEKVFEAKPRTECTASQLNFREYAEQSESGDEDIWQGRADLIRDLPAMGDKSFLKFGVKYRATDKDFDSNNDVWVRGLTGATRFTLAQFGLDGPPVDSYPDDGDRAFLIAPTLDADALQAFTAENLPGPFFLVDAAATLANATLNDFDVNEDVAAAYAMANLQFGQLTLTPGLRFEHTKSAISGFRLEGANTVVPTDGRNSYNDILPSLILRLEPRRNVVLRAAYTRSLGRPNYGQLSPGGALTFEDADTDLRFEGSFASGNSDLKPYRADNLDLSAEYYFGRGGLIAVGAFAKFIKNPIFTQSVTQMDVNFANRDFERLVTRQPLNADDGEILGIEAAYQQQFTFLPGFLSGFGVELNGTLISSKLELPDGRETTFPQQSDFLYGAQLFYQRGPFEASIAFHNTGKSLIVVGEEEFEDQFNDDLRRLDAKASSQVHKNLSLFVEGQNLTDEPTRQFQWDRPDWLIQNERYGRTFYAGISARL
jgi:TonB-dependent receptor